MNTGHDTPRAPLRAERPATRDAMGHIRGVEATSGGLIRSTLIASGAAAAMLTVVYLPAEYGIDPTGFGALLGLTEMGLIKQQLYAEAEADEAAAANAPVTLDADTLARLDRIEAQLATIGATIGAPPAVTEAAAAPAEEVAATAPAPEAAPEPVPEGAAEPAPEAAPTETATAVDAAVAEATSDWRDEVSYTLAPGEGIEVKLAMQEGQTARFFWTANGAVVNYDTHGDGSGQKVSYEQGRGVPEQEGTLTAAFTGNHGWFWRNRTDAPVTVTLRTAGDYAEMKAP
ncbi:MAG: hypothetical protein RIR62_758 [Pseudomonadota bacterium]